MKRTDLRVYLFLESDATAADNTADAWAKRLGLGLKVPPSDAVRNESGDPLEGLQFVTEQGALPSIAAAQVGAFVSLVVMFPCKAFVPLNDDPPVPAMPPYGVARIRLTERKNFRSWEPTGPHARFPWGVLSWDSVEEWGVNAGEDSPGMIDYLFRELKPIQLAAAVISVSRLVREIEIAVNGASAGVSDHGKTAHLVEKKWKSVCEQTAVVEDVIAAALPAVESSLRRKIQAWRSERSEFALRLAQRIGVKVTSLPANFAMSGAISGSHGPESPRIPSVRVGPLEKGRRAMQFSDLKGRVDVGIITIRQDEYDAVYDRLFEPNATEGGHRTYSISTVTTRDGSKRTVCLVKSISQGNGPAQDATRDMIEDLNPQWILLVGIAGGVAADEFSLGDVILATEIKDLRTQALNQDKEPERAIHAAPAHKSVSDIASALRPLEKHLDGWSSRKSIGRSRPPVSLDEPTDFYGPQEWQSKVRDSLQRHFGGAKRKRNPIVLAGPIASSDNLVKDASAVEAWRKSVRDILGFEMEAAGVFEAANRRHGAYPVFAVRGISDIVGYKRHADWTMYACHSAAAFAVALIRSSLLGPISRPR
ncbi:MAG: hypothetical protein HYZ53_23675 [Planctomycetes bacterium]|nr:hypothetical protein [Planctomycetota bacterium]